MKTMNAPIEELKSKLELNESGIYAKAWKLKTSSVGDYLLNVIGDVHKLYYRSDLVRTWNEKALDN